MNKKHDILSEIKRIADSLGRKPTRDEFKKLGSISVRQVMNEFGSFTSAIVAAGFSLPGLEESAKERLISSVYTRHPRELIKAPSETHKALGFGDYTPTLCAGDIHFPWASQDALSMFYCLVEQLSPKRIIQMGDLFDMFSFASFSKSRLITRADQEILEGRKMAESFWSTIRKLAPNAELVQILGNHDIRPYKRLIESDFPELECFFDYRKLFQFDGVQTILDTRELFEREKVNYTHGHLPSGKHCAYFGTNVVHGHTHRGGLLDRKVNGVWMWELDVGYLGDPQAPCFTYTPKAVNNSAHGAGFISPFGPHWIPFLK